jgi:hypothetical protein
LNCYFGPLVAHVLIELLSSQQHASDEAIIGKTIQKKENTMTIGRSSLFTLLFILSHSALANTNSETTRSISEDRMLVRATHAMENAMNRPLTETQFRTIKDSLAEYYSRSSATRVQYAEASGVASTSTTRSSLVCAFVEAGVIPVITPQVHGYLCYNINNGETYIGLGGGIGVRIADVGAGGFGGGLMSIYHPIDEEIDGDYACVGGAYVYFFGGEGSLCQAESAHQGSSKEMVFFGALIGGRVGVSAEYLKLQKL